MKHLIPKSHHGQPLLLVALLAASTGVAQAQATPPDAGTVGVTVNNVDPAEKVAGNPATMYVTTTASAGAVDATARTTLTFLHDGASQGSVVNYFSVPKRTRNLSQQSSLTHVLRYAGQWTAGATAVLSATGTTSVTSISALGFVVFGQEEADPNLVGGAGPRR